MKVGDLVKIMRGSIGIPVGSAGLIIKKLKCQRCLDSKFSELFEIQVLGVTHSRRYWNGDLELLNESR